MNENIATITPTRGDRPQFVSIAKKLIKLQTCQPDEVIIVDDPPKSDAVDINWRYHEGCRRAIEKGCDLLIFWEDDDYYAPHYIEALVAAYRTFIPQPLVFGLGDTIYYNMRLRKWSKIIHPGRASAMNTLVSSEVYHHFPWSQDNSKVYDSVHGAGFFDRQLWDWAQKEGVGKTISTDISSPWSIGIKHGIGKCGGSHHDTKESSWLVPLKMKDPDLSWLRSHVRPEIFPLYEKLAQDLHYSR